MADSCAASCDMPPSWPKNASSVWSPRATRRKCETRDATCSTTSQEAPRASAQSACLARESKASMQATCLGSSDRGARLYKFVNEARALTIASRATSMRKAAATVAEIFSPSKAYAAAVFAPTAPPFCGSAPLAGGCVDSNACENAERAGPQATSNILCAAAAFTTSVCADARTPRSPPAPCRPCLKSDTDARTMSSRSRWKASAFFRVGLAPAKPKVTARDSCCGGSANWRCLSSSAKVMGVDLIRSKMPSRKSPGMSSPLEMPRLFRRKPSLVIFFSSFTAGLCRSVCSMMVEKAKMNAASAFLKGDPMRPAGSSAAAHFGARADHCAWSCDAKASISRSMHCASPGRWKPARKSFREASKVRPPKSHVEAYSRSTSALKGYLSGGPLLRYSPRTRLSKSGTSRISAATAPASAADSKSPSCCTCLSQSFSCALNSSAALARRFFRFFRSCSTAALRSRAAASHSRSPSSSFRSTAESWARWRIAVEASDVSESERGLSSIFGRHRCEMDSTTAKTPSKLRRFKTLTGRPGRGVEAEARRLQIVSKRFVHWTSQS
mmetsp:Transcript_17274/g.61422  ORF Transcript_17274/g.61422 Transcript_17274/m.61422 type:complete len:557 (+) Transcript_17274:2473-4143(+)